MKTFKQFNEGLGSVRIVPALVKTGLAGLGLYGVKKGAEKLGTMSGTPKKKFDPIGDARKKYQNKKATEYEKKSGTSKEDGYFR